MVRARRVHEDGGCHVDDPRAPPPSWRHGSSSTNLGLLQQGTAKTQGNYKESLSGRQTYYYRLRARRQNKGAQATARRPEGDRPSSSSIETAVQNVSSQARTNKILHKYVDSKIRTYHGVESGRHGRAGRGGASRVKEDAPEGFQGGFKPNPKPI